MPPDIFTICWDNSVRSLHNGVENPLALCRGSPPLPAPNPIPPVRTNLLSLTGAWLTPSSKLLGLVSNQNWSIAEQFFFNSVTVSTTVIIGGILAIVEKTKKQTSWAPSPMSQVVPPDCDADEQVSQAGSPIRFHEQGGRAGGTRLPLKPGYRGSSGLARPRGRVTVEVVAVLDHFPRPNGVVWVILQDGRPMHHWVVL